MSRRIEYKKLETCSGMIILMGDTHKLPGRDNGCDHTGVIMVQRETVRVESKKRF